jgi:hypothetical protein
MPGTDFCGNETAKGTQECPAPNFAKKAHGTLGARGQRGRPLFAYHFIHVPGRGFVNNFGFSAEADGGYGGNTDKPLFMPREKKPPTALRPQFGGPDKEMRGISKAAKPPFNAAQAASVQPERYPAGTYKARIGH